MEKIKDMKNIKNRIVLKVFLLVVLVCSVICVFYGPDKVNAAVKAKVILEFSDGSQETWKTGDAKINCGERQLKYVYFGNYPQSEVTEKKLIKTLKKATYNENKFTKINGVKYKRICYDDAYFDQGDYG